MIYALGLSACFLVICNVAVQIMIVSYLRKRGYAVNFWLIRIYIIKYVRQYREDTIKKYGKPGPLFPAFIVSLVLLVPLLISLFVLLV